MKVDVKVDDKTSYTMEKRSNTTSINDSQENKKNRSSAQSRENTTSPRKSSAYRTSGEYQGQGEKELRSKRTKKTTTHAS